jgi:hypothetical protein
MSEVIDALDTYTNKHPNSIGENGHAQYGWSTDIESAIVQYQFQVVRGNNVQLENLSFIMIEIIEKIHLFEEKDKQTIYLIILYKILAQTRDIIAGKGECQLAYMMVYVWWLYYQDLAYFAIRQFTAGDAIQEDAKDQPESPERLPHQYGCWKDIKYLCQYVYNKTGDYDHPIINYCIELISEQIKNDHHRYNIGQPISLCGRWIPRESSKYGWLFKKIAKHYFYHYYQSALTSIAPDSVKKSVLKSRQDMRIIVSKLNRHLDTIQIKQCANVWDEIDHNKTTSITLVKQRKALLNQTKTGEQRSSEAHRILCAEKFNRYIQSKIKNGETLKGKCVSMADFTKQAIQIKFEERNSLFDKTHKTILDSQWCDSSKDTNSLGNIVAMCDTSGSMEGDPLNVCIALGIRIAEKSKLGKRVMTFSSTPTWLNLSRFDSFVDTVDCMVQDIESKGVSTNFYAALDLLLNAIVEKNLDQETVKNMSLIILSDMQINEGDESWDDSLYERINKKYQEAGLKAIGQPYIMPHLIFWNLRGTNGFPVLTKQKNATMMSGFSPSLLNDICTKGVDAFETYTPYNNLVESLSKKRYLCMEEAFLQFLK